MGCLKITENTGAIRLGKNHFFLGDTYEKKEVPQNFCNDYYPFGLSFNSYTRAAITDQNFKFNAGSELESMTDWYSTPFRKYDPSLGRFHGVDALASMYSSWSPSHFAGNNPINYNDPTGLHWDDPDGEVSAPGNAFNNSSVMVREGHWSDQVYASMGTVEADKRNMSVMSDEVFGDFYGETKDEVLAGHAKEKATKNGDSYKLVDVKDHWSISEGWATRTEVEYIYEVVKASKELDPYEYHFMTNESEAYLIMLELQANHKVEIAAYLAKNSSGQNGILILPWVDNLERKSKTYWNDVVNGNIEDWDGNTYSIFGYIHTHSLAIIPSPQDLLFARESGIDTYILSGIEYLLIDPSAGMYDQPEGGDTVFLLNGSESLLGK